MHWFTFTMEDLIDIVELSGDFLDYTPGDLLDGDTLDRLGNLLSDADFTSFSPAFLEKVATLGADSMDLVSTLGDGAIDFPISEIADAGFLGDPDEFSAFASGRLLLDVAPDAIGEFTSEAASGLWSATHSEKMVEHLSSLFEGVPDVFKEGITSVNYHPIPPEGIDFLGNWSNHGIGETGQVLSSINLFDHATQAPITLFHEIGHHIEANHPLFFQEVSSQIKEAPELVSQLRPLLSQYNPEQFASEAFAEVIGLFNTQPEILNALSPDVFESVSKWWMSEQAPA